MEETSMAPQGERAEGVAHPYQLPVWFTKADIIEYARRLDPPVRPEVASRAFSALWHNTEDLGLTLHCGFAVHKGKFCVAPHWLKTAEFIATPGEVVLAAYGCGRSLADLLAGFRSRLAEG